MDLHIFNLLIINNYFFENIKNYLILK